MISTTYISAESDKFTPAALLNLLQQCHQNNPGRGLTGMLIFGNGIFLQSIEGDDAVVDALIEKIKNDPRHKDFRLLSRETIHKRLFGNWSMGFERLTEQTLLDAPGLGNFVFKDFSPDYLSKNPTVVENLLQRHRSQHWDPLVREIDARERFIEELRRALAGARQQNEMAALLIESLIESAGTGPIGSDHLGLCRSVLATLRRD